LSLSTSLKIPSLTITVQISSQGCAVFSDLSPVLCHDR
jgi:hypothetical protein